MSAGPFIMVRLSAALACGLSVAACSDTPTEPTEGETDVLAFTLSASGNRGRIHTIRADGTDMRPVHPTCGGRFAWSPTGRWLMADCYAVLTLIDVDGGQVRSLEVTDFGIGYWRTGVISWKPDESKVAFDNFVSLENRTDIFVVNRDGTGLINLTDNGERSSRPSWSPDGTRLAFSNDGPSWWGVYWSDEAGSEFAQALPGSNNTQPVWSPDGDGIASCHDEGVLIRWPLAGPTRLFEAPGALHCAWSPSGTQIAVETFDDIRVIDVGSWTSIVLVEGSDADGPLAWSPDGSRLAYLSEVEAQRWVVRAIDADGRNDVAVIGPTVSIQTDAGTEDFTVADWSLAWRPRRP